MQGEDKVDFAVTTISQDYSAGKGGALVAYRFDGEPNLSLEQFVWVA